MSAMAAWMAGAPGPQACNIAVPPVPEPGQLQEARWRSYSLLRGSLREPERFTDCEEVGISMFAQKIM